MANGDNKDLWEKVNGIAAHGCGIREFHEKAVKDLERFATKSTDELWSAINTEREARGVMKEKLEDKMDSTRNQILVGMGLMLIVAGVIAKILG